MNTLLRVFNLFYLNHDFYLKNNVEKNPILNVMHNIPEDKRDEVIERIMILKKSWDWKSKDECKVIESSTSMEGMHW